MAKYNPEIINKYKDGIIGIYIEDLKSISIGDIPTNFETHYNMSKEALPFFSISRRLKYFRILEAGYKQVQYLRSLSEVSSLKIGEKARRKTINNFLKDDDFK